MAMSTKTPSKQFSRPLSKPGTPSSRATFDGTSASRYANMTFDSTMNVGGKGDMTNPFITKPTSSPVKRPPSRPGSAMSGHSRSGMGIGGGSMDIVGDRDEGMMDRGRDRSEVDKGPFGGGSGGMKFSTGRNLDRFIPSRSSSVDPSLASAAGDMSNYSISGDDDYMTNVSMASNTSDAQPGAPHTRILSFAAAPPSASSHNPHASSHLSLSRQYAKPGAGRAGSSASGAAAAAAATAKARRLPQTPDRVLDAPGFMDDYYLNLISWSCTNKVAIALGDTVYIWNAETGDVTGLHTQMETELPMVTSLSWASDGSYLAVGNESGSVEIWDVDTAKRMRNMTGHLARVPSLSWNGSVVSSGCRDGTIWHHDVRVQNHKVQELKGHNAEVCGLAWRADGQFLASGGNDNIVNCWDGRIGQSVINNEESLPSQGPKWQKHNHTAAVKALAWCPWQNSLLATGGGTSDQTIHFWSSTTGARVSSLPTTSQVTGLVWSNHTKEIMSTHGYPDNHWTLWSYPSLSKVHEVTGAHDKRILGSSISPDGCTVVTGAADESLKFWKLWEPKVSSKMKTAERDENGAVRNKSSVSMWR